MRNENFICLETLLSHVEIEGVMLEEWLEAAEKETEEIENKLTDAYDKETKIRRELKKNKIFQSSLEETISRIEKEFKL